MSSRAFALGAVAVAVAVACLAGCDDCSSKGGGAAADSAASADATATATATRTNDDGGVLNATTAPTASVAKMVNPHGLPAYTGATGVLEGVITVTGDDAPKTPASFSKCADAEKTWGHAFREGPRGPQGERPLADAVVVVTGYKGTFVPEKDEAEEVRIERCAYTTRTVTMTYGQRLDVKNLSKDFWTPILEPGSNLIMMMAPPSGDPVKVYPKEPGHYLLMDRERAYVVVDVYAFLHPLHAATTLAGYYRIEGVPVGKLKVSTTHPQINATAEAEVEITAGATTKADLTLAYKFVPKPDAGAPADAGPDAPYHPILR